MTKPKPFPWREPLRYTLECRQQGGNWWIAAGEVTLNDEWKDIVWDETPWAFNIRVSCGFVLVSETKIPKTGKSVSKNRINWMKTQSEFGVLQEKHVICFVIIFEKIKNYHIPQN